MASPGGNGAAPLSAWIRQRLHAAALCSTSLPGWLDAAIPRSRALADLITREIVPQYQPVLDLGAGSGRFGDALLRRGLCETQLVLVEADYALFRRLCQRFPRATIRCCEVARMAEMPGERLLAGAVISGLPLRNMADEVVRAVIVRAQSYLKPGGCIYQFTHGWTSPVSAALLTELHLSCERVGTTWRAFPPATVYRYSQSSYDTRVQGRNDRHPLRDRSTP